MIKILERLAQWVLPPPPSELATATTTPEQSVARGIGEPGDLDAFAPFGLPPDRACLPQIRQVLEEQAECERKGKPREDDLALMCAVQLFACAEPADVLNIWRAKRSGMDLDFSLGVQLLCGMGLNETKAWLQSQANRVCTAIYDYICSCQASGDFDGFSPESELEMHVTYFSGT